MALETGQEESRQCGGRLGKKSPLITATACVPGSPKLLRTFSHPQYGVAPLATVWKNWKLSFACTKITNGGEETETETGVQGWGE